MSFLDEGFFQYMNLAMMVTWRTTLPSDLECSVCLNRPHAVLCVGTRTL